MCVAKKEGINERNEGNIVKFDGSWSAGKTNARMSTEKKEERQDEVRSE